MSERIAELARRVESDPYFLASALALYAHAEGLSDVHLAARLKCTPSQLNSVRLCRKPRSSGKEFQFDVERIALAFHLDPMVIAEAVRLADSLSALGKIHESGGFLMAARDRETHEAGDIPKETES